MQPVVLLTALAALLVASWSDIRTREVPDWLNYGLIATGIAFAALSSLIFHSWQPLAFSAAGLALFVALGYAMFYAGQWGGGDSKLLMGMGALLGFPFLLQAPFIDLENSVLIAFLINTLLAGLFYALAYSITLAFRHRQAVAGAYHAYMQRMHRQQLLVVLATALLLLFPLLAGADLAPYAFLMAVLPFATFHALAFVKAVELACLYKHVSPLLLTEGDWIAHDVFVDGKRICGPKDLGVSKAQMRQLATLHRKKKVKTIPVREGIPFVPSFLLGFLITLHWGNALFLFL